MKPRFSFAKSARGQATLAVIMIVASACPAVAADSTWSSTANGNWTGSANWTSGVPGATTGTGNADVATFNGYGNPLVTVPTSENFAGITFGTTGLTANGFILNGGTLLPSNNATIQSGSTFRGTADVVTGITAQGNLNLTAGGLAGSGMVFNAITTAASSGSVTLALSGANSGYNNIVNNSIAGVISQNATASTLAVSKTGTGTWYLGGTNTYTGGTTLNGGMVVAGNAAAFGSAGTIAVTGNTTIRTQAGLTDPSARISISDDVTLTLDSYGASQTWAGVVGNSGGSNTAALTKTGLGTLTIAPAAGVVQTWKGTTTVNMGVLTISGTNQTANFTNLINSSSALVLGGGAVNFTGKASFTNSQTFNGTTLNAGISQFIPAASTGTNTFDFGAITRNAGSLLNLTNASGYSFKAGATANDAGGLVKGVLFAGNDFMTNNGTNLVATSYTTQNAAGSWSSATANYVTGGAVTGATATAAVINSLKLNNASSQKFTITDTLTVNDGILFGTSIGANLSEISGGILSGPAGGDLIVVNNNAQNTYGRNTISSVIADNGGASNVILYTVNSGGNSNLFLSGINTYTGNTYVGGSSNAATNNVYVTVGGAAGARIGSSLATVYVNGGGGGTVNNLRVGNNDATGDILGTIQLDNGRLSLNRSDAFALTANVTGGTGGGSIVQDSTGTATVNFKAGNNVFNSLLNNAAGTLTLTGVGSVNTFNAPAAFNASATTNFNSGSFYFVGPANAGANTLGTWNVNGAEIIFGGGRYMNVVGGTLTLNSGSVKINGDRFTSNDYANTTPIIYNVNGGIFDVAPNQFDWVLSGPAAATGSSTFNQSAGVVQAGLTPSSTNATVSKLGLTVGVAGSAHASAYNLSGGTLRVAGTIASAQIASQGGVVLTTGSTTAGVSGNNTAVSLQAGFGVTGTGIPASTTISAIASNSTAPSVAVTSGATSITVTSTTGLAAGQYVGGSAGIAAGTTITAVDTGTKVVSLSTATIAAIATTVSLNFNQITLSSAATATATNQTLSFGSTLTSNIASFNWTGGTLTSGTINMTGMSSNDGVNSATSTVLAPTGTLYQGGSTAVMAPGETLNSLVYAGKTTLTGNYQIDAGALSVGIGGTTQASVFHDALAKYDTVAVSGTVVVGGSLNVALRNGFSPGALDTFTIVSGSSVSGTFSNLSGGRVALTGGASFAVTIGAASVVLSDYQNGGNTAPTITAIANQSVPSGGVTPALAFTVGDDLTAVGSLTLTGGSSNTTLVPNANIVFGGSGASRTVTVTPVSGLSGSATITVTVNDGSLATNTTFTLSVTDNYLSWATANSVTGGPGGDSDNDGVTNLVEYALVNGGERGVLTGNTITFTKRGAPYGSDITYDIETSTLLTAGSWTTQAKPIPVSETSSSISYTFAPPTPVKNFARLKVVQP